MKPSESWNEEGHKHSWGEPTGISKALLVIADQLYQSNKLLREIKKELERRKE